MGREREREPQTISQSHTHVCSLCSALVGDIVHQTCVYCNDNSQWSEEEVCVREERFLCMLLRMKCGWTFHVADRQQG